MQNVSSNASSNSTGNKPMIWKLISSPHGIDSKKKLFRVNVQCGFTSRSSEYKEKKFSATKSSDSTIDDNYCSIPPKREFAIIGLNDNIDENFLRGLCKKDLDPFEVTVYYNPITNKHLGIALMDFKSKVDSDAFIAKHNEKTMMGSIVSCFYDPMGYKLSNIFKKLTNMSAPIPKRYVNIKDNKIFCNLHELLKKLYSDEPKTSPIKENDSLCVKVSDAENSKINEDVENGNEKSAHSLSPTTTSTTTNQLCNKKKTQDNISRSSVETHSDTDSRSDSSSENEKIKKRNLKKETDLLLSTKIYDCNVNVASTSFQQPPRLSKTEHKKRGTHRWSSSSEDDNSSSSDKNEKRKINLSVKTVQNITVEKKPDKQKYFFNNLNLTNSVPPTNGNKGPSISPIKAITPVSSFSSTRQFSNSVQSSASNLSLIDSKTKRIFHESFPRTSSLSNQFLFPLMTHVPPPCLINPPPPVSLMNNSTTKTLNSPTKQRTNLKQRLKQIFGESTSKDNASTESNFSSKKSFFDNLNPSACPKMPFNSNTQQNYNSLHSAAATTSYYQKSYNQNLDAQQPSVPHPTEEVDEQTRINAKIIKERVEKISRCFEVTKKARNALEVEFKIILQKDLQRRLEIEAFKFLNEEWQQMEEEKKKKESKLVAVTNSVNRQTKSTISESSKFLSIFPTFDNVLEEALEGNENIFGISYTERMCTLPSFKKKQVIEVKKPTYSSSRRNRRDRDRKYRDEVDYRRKSKDRNRNELTSRKNHYHRYESERKKSYSIDEDSDFERKEKNNQKISTINKKTTEKKSSVERVFKRSKSISSISSSSKSSTSESSSNEAEENEEDRDFSQQCSASQVTSEGEDAISEDADEDHETQKDSEEESDNELQIKNKLKQSNTKFEKILKQKNEILESLENNSVVSLPADEVLVKKQTTTEAVLSASNFTKNENEKCSDLSFTPPLKRTKLTRELASIFDNGNLELTVYPYKEDSKTYSIRSPLEEKEILYKFQQHGFSEEDCAFLKMASMKLCDYFNNYLPEGRTLCWVQPNIIRPKSVKRDQLELHYDDPDLFGIVPHNTGCARTEGFYKINKQRKRIMRRFDENNLRTIISTQDELAVRHKTQAAKDERAMNRRLLTWMGGDSNLLRVNQLKYRSKMIKFARSRIHGWGLYSLETIAPEEMIIEYVGEKVRITVADEREKNYERRGMGSSYMFRIDGDIVIDATKMGNYGRFINHSCLPNCTARVVTVDGDKRIVIYSKRLIEKGEEITYDYKFAREDEASKIECLCGSKCCQKYLN